MHLDLVLRTTKQRVRSHRAFPLLCALACGCAGADNMQLDSDNTAVAGSQAASSEPQKAPTVGMATAMQAMRAGMESNPAVGSAVAGAGVPSTAAAAGASAPVAGAGATAAAPAGAAGTMSVAGMGAAGSGGSMPMSMSMSMSMGTAGAAGASGMAPVAATDAATACGEGAHMVMGASPRKQGYGNTNLRTSGDVEFLNVKSTVLVPKEPAPERGTLFLWPGLQPLQMERGFGYGVLQPVLTWGTSCADMTNVSYDHWWISGVYVGTTPGSWTNILCEAGEPMDTEIGDLLDMEMALEGTVWTQTITNRKSGMTVSFDYDLKGQKQQWMLHQIEAQGQTKPTEDVIFTNVVAQLSDSQPEACVPSETGMNDYYSPPMASADGKTCCFSKIILRASGIMATTPDEP